MAVHRGPRDASLKGPLPVPTLIVAGIAGIPTLALGIAVVGFGPSMVLIDWLRRRKFLKERKHQALNGDTPKQLRSGDTYLSQR